MLRHFKWLMNVIGSAYFFKMVRKWKFGGLYRRPTWLQKGLESQAHGAVCGDTELYIQSKNIPASASLSIV